MVLSNAETFAGLRHFGFANPVILIPEQRACGGLLRQLLVSANASLPAFSLSARQQQLPVLNSKCVYKCVYPVLHDQRLDDERISV